MKKLFCLLFLAILFLPEVSPLMAQSENQLYTFPFGIAAYTYRNSFPKGVEATLDTIKSFGITEFEGSAPQGLTPEEFKKMTDARGIRIPSTGVGSYDQMVKDPSEAIKRAKALGASYVVIFSIPHEKGNFTLENAKKAVEDFNKAGKIFKENGLTFCYHNHGQEFIPYQDGTLYDYIVQNTNPEYVSFQLDLIWATMGGADPVALLNKYGNRYKLIHMKDLKKGVKSDGKGSLPAEDNVPLGQGQIDIEGVIRAAKKAGIQHYYIEDESKNPTEQIPQSIAYLKSLKK
ncbi:sugar phosphate isomerase/epimerase [soil metagenome]